ncbi:Uncharacterized metal-dependent hydrolase YcfH [hydrothermal vent metagenome]|uniref:Uncharacterized metal-dependent hydrolase YcfH n=1 Tax=hydrothermal vent metagenome TaxID=652676 RepID=A0A3B0TAN3_9ZZZZ
MKIIDSHAHLDHIKNLDQALNNAHKENVSDIVAVSESLSSCQRNLKIYEQFKLPKIHLALGIHPSEASDVEIDPVCSLIKEKVSKLIAVGEIGLDFWYKWVRKDKEKKDEQRRVFKKQLEVAKELNLPVIVHTRGTWKEAFEMVKNLKIESAEFHWYSGPIDVLSLILDAGYFVSTSPSVAFSPQSREAMTYAPIEQTMVETDSPVFFRNKENDSLSFEAQPKDVWQTLKAYADLKGIEEEKALGILNQNARKFFKI